jgi:hypothetical protein
MRMMHGRKKLGFRMRQMPKRQPVAVTARESGFWRRRARCSREPRLPSDAAAGHPWLAGVGYGTFYLYLDDKQACFRAFVPAAREEMTQFLRPRLDAPAGWTPTSPR